MIFESADVGLYDYKTRDIDTYLTALWYYNPGFFMRFINALTVEKIIKWNGLSCDGVVECRAKVSSTERLKTLCFANVPFHLFILADKKRISDYNVLYDYVKFIVDNLHNGYPNIMLFVSDKDYSETVKKVKNIRKDIKDGCDIHIVKWSVYVKTKKTYKDFIGFE